MAMDTKVKITKTQYEILEHRLDIPDCIHEVLNDDLEEPRVAIEPVEESCEKLKALAKRGTIDWSTLTDLDKEVLWDAIDGSTFMGCADGAVGVYISSQKYWGFSRSFNNLVDKLQAAGMPTIFCGFI
jgi:hypothetical protein